MKAFLESSGHVFVNIDQSLQNQSSGKFYLI